MSNNEISIWLQCNKQDLQDFINWSSKWPMKGENDVANYLEDLWSLAGPLLAFNYLSERECHKLFLQGFHPGNQAKLTPNLEQQIQDMVWMMKNTILQHLSNDLSALPTPSSAHAPPPHIPEMLTSPTDPTASVLVAPVDPSPAPSSFAHTLNLSMASPSSPQAISRPKGSRRIATTIPRTLATWPTPVSDHLSLIPPSPLMLLLPPSPTSPPPLLSSLLPPPVLPPSQPPPTP